MGHKKSGQATKYAGNTENVMKSGCSYYSHEFSANDCKFYLDLSEYTEPYKFIRTMNMIRRPLDHAFSALGHYARYHEKGMKERCSGLHEYLGNHYLLSSNGNNELFMKVVNAVCMIYIICRQQDLHMVT